MIFLNKKYLIFVLISIELYERMNEKQMWVVNESLFKNANPFGFDDQSSVWI